MANQTTSRVTDAFLTVTRHKLLREYWPRLKSTVESLSNEQVWWRPNEASNSVGNLLLHLNGNVRQWLIASFTKTADVRDRPSEFTQRTPISTPALLGQLGRTIEEAGEVLSRLSEDELLTSFAIQGYTVTGLEAVYAVLEHFSMHYGQVLYVAKMLRGENLGFYRELDKTGRAG